MDIRLQTIQKQINIEQKVKAGAENMTRLYYSGGSRDKKLLHEAQHALKDSNVKLEVLRMKRQKLMAQIENGGDNTSTKQDKTFHNPEQRIEQLRYRIFIEQQVMRGASNMLQVARDKKAQQEVSIGLYYLSPFCSTVTVLKITVGHCPISKLKIVGADISISHLVQAQNCFCSFVSAQGRVCRRSRTFQSHC